MRASDSTILVDEVPVPFEPGKTILQAALEAEVYIPHLCAHPEFAPHGSCKLCNVGNHFCPGCEKSGNCQLQALAYDSEMMTPHFVEFYPHRPMDASHPDVLIDFNRCIQCEPCVRASSDADGKFIFALAGRGMASHIVSNSPSGRLGDTNFSVADKAAHVCPVGAILIKRVGYAVPIGERRYDLEPINAEARRCVVGEAK